MSLADLAFAVARDPKHYGQASSNIEYSLHKEHPLSLTNMSSTMATQIPQPHPEAHCRQDSYDEDMYHEFRQHVSEAPGLVPQGTTIEAMAKMGQLLKSQESSLASPPTPPLPRKSAFRSRSRSSTRPFDMGLELGGAKQPLAPTESQPQPTPHDLYLSSEEDASSSADDLSDFEWESGSEFEYADEVDASSSSSNSSNSSSSADSPSRPRRRSHEITARVVSVVYAGKPAIIDLSAANKASSRSDSSRSSSSSSSTPALSPATTTTTTPSNAAEQQRRPATSGPRTETVRTPPKGIRSVSAATSFARRLSVSSMASMSPGPSAATTTPVKNKNVLATVFSRKTPQPLFLNTDPFATGSVTSLATISRRSTSMSVCEDSSYPRAPKTPTEKFRDFSVRGGALLKKRSRSIMNAATNSLRESYNVTAPPLPEGSRENSRENSRSSTPAPASTPDRAPSTADYFSTPASSARSAPAGPSAPDQFVTPTKTRGGGGLFNTLGARRPSIKNPIKQ